jgi:hypothetical protein
MKLRSASYSHDENDERPGDRCGKEGHYHRHATPGREELDLHRLGVLGKEIDETDAQHHGDSYSQPCRAYACRASSLLFRLRTRVGAGNGGGLRVDLLSCHRFASTLYGLVEPLLARAQWSWFTPRG